MKLLGVTSWGLFLVASGLCGFVMLGALALIASLFVRCRSCGAVIFPLILNNGPAKGRDARLFRAVKAGLTGSDFECCCGTRSAFNGE
jgi:hypothetical protein